MLTFVLAGTVGVRVCFSGASSEAYTVFSMGNTSRTRIWGSGWRWPTWPSSVAVCWWTSRNKPRSRYDASWIDSWPLVKRRYPRTPKLGDFSKQMQPPISCNTLSPRSNLLGTQRANNLPALQEPVPSVVRCWCSGTFAKCSVVQSVNKCWTLTPRTGRFTEDANKQTDNCLLRERRNVCEQFMGKQSSRRTTAVRTEVLTFPPKQKNTKKTECLAHRPMFNHGCLKESLKDDAVRAYKCRLNGPPTASSRTGKSATQYAVVLWLLWVRLRCITPTTPSAASSLPLQREGRPEDSHL